MSKIPEKFLKPYNPNENEKRIYQKWEESGLFNPDIAIAKGIIKQNAEKFSIVLPPPNVTGILHMGHASMLTIEDIMVRYHRMTGKKTLWIPGTDHAAIATQSVVEKKLAKEGIKKNDLGREKFLEQVNQFAQESHDTIATQIKIMGASVDWSREAFTLDEKRKLAVYTAFEKMYQEGLIYRGFRIVNWDPKGQTTISDDEVIYQPNKAKLYYLKYSPDFPITIATTRPETKVGDTGVAVNPNDARYKKFIGKIFELNFCGVPLKIKIFGDENIDPEFGTGAVGITPAHSFVDFDMAQKNDLPIIPVINEYAKMHIENEQIESKAENEILNGKKTLEAREIIIEWLEKNNLLEKTEEIEQNISTAERTGGIIEPLPKLQWFINVNKKIKVGNSKLKNIPSNSETTLKEIMRISVESGQIKIVPNRFEKTYYHWINNLNDWCISRQIWYGHQIPVWYKNQNTPQEEIYVGLEKPQEDGWIQDPDTLDTWFSSGLWTFSTLGWPENTEDFETYHPTSVLETGTDILFFWVARMILMSGYLLNDIPFKTVYLQGLVRDAQGRKLSKSLGNGGNPTEYAEKFGTDAMRMALTVGFGPGNDLNLSEEKIKAYKKFANKIWNASRFVLESVIDDDGKIVNNIEKIILDDDDQKNITEFEEILEDITDDMNNFRFYLASEKIYHYFWHTFADIIIEESKKYLAENNQRKLSRQKMLYCLLLKNLKVLHPFMPFVTEEIWQNLPQKESDFLMVAHW
jgi:valyl-tRNA synthetase